MRFEAKSMSSSACSIGYTLSKSVKLVRKGIEVKM